MFIGIFFIVMGLAFAGFSTYLTKLGLAAMSWPTVTAKKVRDGMENSRTKFGETYSEGYYMFYEYTVDGEHFTGANISFRPKTRSERRQDGEKYQDTIEVNAYYNPKKPHMSVLEPGINKRNYIAITVGVTFALIGVAFLVFDI